MALKALLTSLEAELDNDCYPPNVPMPPSLALLICVGFVLFLLRLERQSLGVSAALWIPTLWLLLTSSKPLAMWFSASQE